jgi:uncharacterized protein involved in type VI secretion and phage assembly
MSQDQRFYGKYRGVVTENQDPLKMGRVKARVPDVLGKEPSGWALPCMPFGGNNMGFYAIPDVDARVWMEFEQGDPDYPIWSGCWWGSQDELPSEASDSPYDRVVIKTSQQQVIILDDSVAGQITIQTSTGQTIVMNSDSIKIDNGQGATVELSGPSVAINDDALEVT